MSARVLGRDIALALAVKLALLIFIWLAFFSPARRPSTDIATHVFGVAPPPASDRR